MRLLALVSLTVLVASATGHEKTNYLYRELRQQGVLVNVGRSIPLPAPTLSDGMTAAEQLAALKQLAGDDYPLDELLRNSVVAPQIYKFRWLDQPSSSEVPPAFAVDCWFVVHASADNLTRNNFESFLNSSGDGSIQILTAADLAKRKITGLGEAGVQEHWVHFKYPLFDKVQLRGTNRTVLTRTAESVVLAKKIDPAFTGDAEFPNQWQTLKEDDQRKFAPVGPASKFEEAGMYLRITKLHEPQDAYLVEFHQVSIEPKEWFNGTNPLRSKLPLLIQAEVRAFRRELKK